MSWEKFQVFKKKQEDDKKKKDDAAMRRFLTEQNDLKRKQRIESTKNNLQNAKRIVAKILPDNKTQEKVKPPHSIYW